MARPVVGIIGNSYLLNDEYPVHAGGQMNSDAVSEVAGCVPMIIPADPRHVSVEELRAFVAARLTGYKRPSRIILATDLPAAPTGKILKHKLLETFAEEL